MTDKVSAILGPTNTGKTYYAVQKMLTFEDGVIGFPLRLLARENFDLIGKQIGSEKVALITGEEKIIPKNAKYFFCTVESMPENKKFDFLAIDEIQLAENSERGHIFTDKILNSRGKYQTLFLGSSSMENLLKKIFPSIQIIKRPRLSKLNYYGYKNLTRLPPRSAVIAFSQIDVYSIAEKIKKFKGGVSVVTGALSPEARNSQVDLFERGEVDYLVATDAIGLGLNLDIKYIFFSSLIKFDGKKRRKLSYDEVSQIAGRAGRNLKDGFFGTTQNLKVLSEDLIKFIEGYEHSGIERIFWRNSELNFSSKRNLFKSLEKRPISSLFIYKKDASDLNYLKLLLEEKNILKKVKNSNDLKLIWEVCGIPDYNKTTDEFHSKFLAVIADFLLRDDFLIPNSWIDLQVKQIKNFPEKISIINMKIAQIRTWSYISFKKNWIKDEKIYQKKIKKIENLLSHKLHQNLINRFVDKTINDHKDLNLNSSIELISITKNNQLFSNRRIIGHLKGFKFIFLEEKLIRKNKSFAYKNIRKSILKISKKVTDQFLNSTLDQLDFNVDGKIFWKKEQIGFFSKGTSILYPKINILSDSFFSLSDNTLIKKKVGKYFSIFFKKKLKVIFAMQEESENKFYSASYRALCFALYENFGHCLKSDYAQYYKALNEKELSFFKNKNLVSGNKFFYLRGENRDLFMIKQMLTNIFYCLKIKEKIYKNLIILNKKMVDKKVFENKKNNKLGYYKISVLQKSYLIYYSFYERLIDSIYFSKKKKISFTEKIIKDSENNIDFIKNCFENPKILFIEQISL